MTARSERHLAEWAWFLIAVGAVLRFQGLNWDSGLMLNPDERNIAFAAARLSWPGTLVPDFHAYNGLALYAPRLLAWLLVPWSGPSGADPGAIVFAGRILSALFASATLPILWWLGRGLFGTPGGLTVLALAVFSPGLIQSAHFATTESGLILALTAILWLSARYVDGGMGLTRYAILCGVVIGLGFGLKTTALVLAILPLASVWMIERPMSSRHEARRTVSAGFLAAVIVAALGVATTPQILLRTADYLATMRFEAGVVSGAADVFWTYQFAGATPVLFELSQLPWLLGPALAAVALAGLAAVLVGLRRNDPVARRLAPAVVFALVYAAIVMSWHARFIRYLTPLIPVLILFAGYLLATLSRPAARKAAAVALVLATALPGLAQALIYELPDARLTAWQWLQPQLQPSDGVVIEPADLGPPYGGVTGGVTTLPLLEASSPDKIEAMAQQLSRARWMIIASRRHHGVLPRLRSRFPEMCGYYASLWAGRLGYTPVARFRRRPVNAVWNPERDAEETFTVFDSAEVVILRNEAGLAADAIAAAIAGADCPPS